MKIRNLTYLIVALLATGLLWGCGSSGGGGSDFVDQQPDPDSVETLGITNCAQCHDNINAKWLESSHANANSTPTGPHAGDSFCGRCHNNLEDGELMPIAYGESIRDVIGCESCHGGGSAHRGIGSLPYPKPDLDRCAQCHEDLTVYGGHAAREPFSDVLAQRFEEGRHTGRARTGTCAACHSHEGFLVYNAFGKVDTIGELEEIEVFLDAIGDNTSVKTCATCHDPHSGELRGLGDVTEVIGADSTSTGPAERVVFSAEYNLCTSCHQANIEADFIETIGYDDGGMFEYSLSDAYLHANDPYGDPANIGFHSNSYQDRSFFDTHFSGLISKDLYYYDIKDGVDKARRDRHGDIIVTDDMVDAITMLEDYYQEYLDAPDDIQVNGYGVNPGSSNACSSCHDVHSANKIEGTADLIKADESGERVGHVLMAEPRMQQAVAYGEGVGMSHNDYIADAFSREADFGSCVPCHTGREFVTQTVGGEPEAARWNSVGCVSCHDMVDKEGVVLTEARTFPDDYAFVFNSDAPLTAEQQLGDNQVCFECHKGRTAYDNDLNVATVYGINYLHYSPSFATMMGTESEMIPTYDDKDYTTGLTLDLAYSAHESTYNNCVACHNIHEEYAPFSSYNTDTQYGREEFDSSLTTNLCGSCHYETDFTEDNYWRSFNVLKKRTEVFADVLKSTITDELATLVGDDNDAAIIIQGVDGANVTLIEDRDEYVDVFGGEPYAADITDEAIAKRLKTYITGSTRDITGSRLVNNNLAKAGAIWKNFMYDDKGWAHNSILARQLMYDATVAVGGAEALDKFCDYIATPTADTIGVQVTSPHPDEYGSLTRNLDTNLDDGTTLRPIVCP
ncbi:MAG: cytochrome c3 family protein [Pelovirga sp.]